MFKDRGNDGLDAGGGSLLSAQLSRTQIVEPASAPVANLAGRYAAWRRRFTERFAEADLVPDIAQDIGSRRWLRGAGTLLGLSALALAGWPDFAPLEAAPVMRIDDPVRDEFRSQMIMPLALGADRPSSVPAPRNQRREPMSWARSGTRSTSAKRSETLWRHAA